MASAAAADETEILIESFADPTHAWTTMSDPVMGGLSTSSVAIADGVGRFEGEVAIVPFLHAREFLRRPTAHRFRALTLHSFLSRLHPNADEQGRDGDLS